LKLGFSSTCATVYLDNDQIIEIDDIKAPPKIMTDGCGFISV